MQNSLFEIVPEQFELAHPQIKCPKRSIVTLSKIKESPPKTTTRTNIPGLSGWGLFAYNVGPKFA